MDHNRFQEAQQAYDAGDFRSAAKQFLASAGRGAEGNGAAYHMAGNSLVRLRRFTDAVTVYGHALRDPLYEKRGAVRANLGAAWVSLGDYAQAADAYEGALAEPDYSARYRAFQGLAGAMLERGKIEEAAVNYRKAALDETNPDPGKALVNLGLCFMGLGRPADAVEAYKAALGFEEYKGRGKALSNLGQAYTVLGEYADACRAFEKATQLHGYKLSASAAAAYKTAQDAAIDEVPEMVEGWETGRMPSTPAQSDTAQGPSAADFPVPPREDAILPGSEDLGFGDEAAVNDFFNMTEDQMLVRDRERRRDQRRENGGAGTIRVLIIVAVVALLIGALVGGGYALGFGWPTQKQTVSDMLTAYGQGAPVTQYWIATPGTAVTDEMRAVPPLTTFTIDNVQHGAHTSIASITITPKTGAPLHYRITLTREGVGWKISGVANDWSSTTGGS